MSYTRVIPRDLFNDANLLKCYGQLYLCLENLGLEHLLIHDDGAFAIEQNPDDGSMSITNITLATIQERYTFYRPLNSRAPYPLIMCVPGGKDIEVFYDNGQFSREMDEFLENAI